MAATKTNSPSMETLADAADFSVRLENFAASHRFLVARVHTLTSQLAESRAKTRAWRRRVLSAHDVDSVVVPLRTAEIIDRVFLPTNPNKMRTAAPGVVQAAREFRAVVNAGPRVTAQAALLAECLVFVRETKCFCSEPASKSCDRCELLAKLEAIA